ncbi:MAG: hypothetical protein ACK5Q5_19005 [Planctomycetaceae bacterium]
MPATVIEEVGRSGGQFARQWRFKVWGVASEGEAIGATYTHLVDQLGAYALLDGLILRDISFDETAVTGVYETTASWGLAAPPEPSATNTFSISFDFAGQPQKVVLPVNPIRVYGESGYLGSNGVRLIGDGGRGEPPEGVEVFEPVLNFSETHYKPSAFVDISYIALLNQLIGRVNSVAWRGFAAGELLATGVSGARRTIRDDWELQFKFAARANKAALNVGGITVYNKNGWDFLWPRTVDNIVNGKLTTIVKDVCLTMPFETQDFVYFGIGI